MRYPDPNNYDSPDDYYDAIDAYKEMQRVKKYGYDGYDAEEIENEDIDYDKAADDYFSERSNIFEYGKYN